MFAVRLGLARLACSLGLILFASVGAVACNDGMDMRNDRDASSPLPSAPSPTGEALVPREKGELGRVEVERMLMTRHICGGVRCPLEQPVQKGAFLQFRLEGPSERYNVQSNNAGIAFVQKHWSSCGCSQGASWRTISHEEQCKPEEKRSCFTDVSVEAKRVGDTKIAIYDPVQGIVDRFPFRVREAATIDVATRIEMPSDSGGVSIAESTPLPTGADGAVEIAKDGVAQMTPLARDAEGNALMRLVGGFEVSAEGAPLIGPEIPYFWGPARVKIDGTTQVAVTFKTRTAATTVLLRPAS